MRFDSSQDKIRFSFHRKYINDSTAFDENIKVLKVYYEVISALKNSPCQNGSSDKSSGTRDLNDSLSFTHRALCCNSNHTIHISCLSLEPYFTFKLIISIALSANFLLLHSQYTCGGQGRQIKKIRFLFSCFNAGFDVLDILKLFLKAAFHRLQYFYQEFIILSSDTTLRIL